MELAAVTMRARTGAGAAEVSSEAVLLHRIAAGEAEAMEQLYSLYGGLAYALALRIVGDAGAAEDIVQDAFLAVWRRSATFDPDRGSVRTWLCSVIRHRSFDRLRARRSRPPEDLPLEHAESESSLPDAWAGVEESLDREAVGRAMATLPPEQREALELAYFGGYSQSEISTMTRVPLGTVKGRTRLGLRRLRAAFTGQEPEWATR